MKVTCPGCGATFDFPETAKTITCPYCGLVFGERAEEDHYYFPSIRQEPYALLLAFLKRQFGIPADLELNSSLLEEKLHYIPVYFYYLKGKAAALCGGKKATESYVCRHVGVVASRDFRRLLHDYPFPIRGKRFFNEEIMSAGVYHEPEFDEDSAEEIAANTLKEKLEEELEKQCKKPRNIGFEELRIDYRGLVHYPIYYLRYRYKGRSYEAYLDGSDGKVILAEHPLRLETRLLQVFSAVGMIAAAFAFGSIFSSILNTILPLITAFIPAVAASIPLLKRGVEIKVTASELRTLTKEESMSPIRALTGLAI